MDRLKIGGILGTQRVQPSTRGGEQLRFKEEYSRLQAACSRRLSHGLRQWRRLVLHGIGWLRHRSPRELYCLVLAVAVILLIGWRLTIALFPQSPVPGIPRTIALDPELLAKYAEEPRIVVYDHAIGVRRSMDMETYLLGVVNAETVPGWHPQTLAAQAVVARTFTIRSMESPDNAPYVLHKSDACTSKDHFQAYQERGIDERIREAVESTRGLVLAYEDTIALTYFSSSSGGMTASLEEGFPRSKEDAPYLTPVPSRDQELAPDYAGEWSSRVSRAQLRALLGPRALTGAPVVIVRQGPSNRAVVIRIGRRQVFAADLRRQLGSEVLRSTLITNIVVGTTHVTFHGVGWGHGVGLDQWGSEVMAQAGHDYQQILFHYFRGTRLQQLWE